MLVRLRYLPRLRDCVVIAAIAALATCTTIEDDTLGRTNPYDPGGTNWTSDLPPVIDSVSLDAQPLWSNYGASTGSVTVTIHARDPNQQYDTLRYRVLVGPAADSLDTVTVSDQNVVEIPGLNLSSRYFWRVEVMDLFDSTDADTGMFTTPAGVPPAAPVNASMTSYSTYLRVQWTPASTAQSRFRVYRAIDTEQVFVLRTDTTVSGSQSTIYVRDTVPDYHIHQYLVAAVNQFGERRYPDTLFGRRYSSGISIPSGFVARFTGCRTISIGWDCYSSYSPLSTQIFRAKSASGNYRLIAQPATVNGWNTFNDVVDDSAAQYYYCLATVIPGGSASALSTAFPAVGLSAPSITGASEGYYSTHIVISWYSVASAAGYYVYRGLSSTQIDTTVPIGATTAATSYYDTVPTLSYYYYRVAARDSCGRVGAKSSYDYGYRTGLSAPGSVSATDGTYDAYIYVSWSTVSSAIGYYVYRSTSSSSLDTIRPIDSTTNPFYRDSVPDAQSYCYKIAAYSTHGSAGYRSSYDCGRRNGPLAPSSLVASDGLFRDQISVSWTAATGATRYVVFRADSVSTATRVAIDTVAGTYYADSALRADLSYYYWVAGMNTVGLVGPLTGPDLGHLSRPGTPGSFYASDGTTAAGIILTWSSAVGAVGYNVYRGSSSLSYVKIGSSLTTTFTDTGVPGLVTFYYRVAAYDSSGREGIPSYYDTGHRLGFGAPAHVVASDGTYYDSVVVRWDAVTDAQRYYVYRATGSSTGTYTHVATTSTARYTDISAVAGTYYYYKITAWQSSAGESTESSYAMGRLTALAPRVPLFSIATTPDFITITVAPDTTGPAIDGYIVYRSSQSSGTYLPVDTTISRVSVDTVRDSLTYYYRVLAYNRIGVGSMSSWSSAALTRLASPTGVRASDSAYYGRVVVQWSGVAAATGYQVQRYPTTTYLWETVGFTQDTVFDDTAPLSASVPYRVFATNVSSVRGYASVSDNGSSRFFLPPSGVTATDQVYTDRIVVSWAAVAGAQSYRVYRGVDAGALASVGSVTGTSYVDADVDSSHTYYYRVSSVSSSPGESPLSVQVSAQVLHSRPLKPSWPSISSSIRTMTVSWTVSTPPLVDGSIVYRGLASGGPLVVLDTCVGTSAYTDTVSDSAQYYYRVAAYNAIGVGPLSDSSVFVQVQRPFSPTDVQASDGLYPDYIYVSWTNPYSGQYPVVIQRQNPPGSTSYIVLDTVGTSDYRDTVVSTLPQYYTVSVLGIRLGPSSLTAQGSILAAPSSPTATGYPDHIDIFWAVVPNTLGYIVYRSSSATGPYAVLDSTTTNFYHDSLATSATYHYRVSAYHVGETRMSDSCSASITPPAVPQSVAASRGTLSDSVRLTWQPSAGATQYVVRRGSVAAGFVPRDTVTAIVFREAVSTDSIYSYTVQALNSVGAGTQSPAVDGYRRPISPPPSPLNVAATSDIRTNVRISWSAIGSQTSVEGYRVQRADLQAGTYVTIASLSATVFQFYDTPPMANPTTYWYRVMANNLAGDSPASAAVQGSALP